VTVSLIAAVAADRVIGDHGRLPWRLPDDLARFRRLTMGHPVVMGRVTHASIGAPLAGRTNIVLTRSRGLRAAGCAVVCTAGEALEAARDAPGSAETFVIGGAGVYALFLPLASRLYITWIDAAVPGDALFPEVAWDDWRILRETDGRATPLPHRFVDYERARQL
jgi:dihydrofolate reductase